MGIRECYECPFLSTGTNYKEEREENTCELYLTIKTGKRLPIIELFCEEESECVYDLPPNQKIKLTPKNIVSILNKNEGWPNSEIFEEDIDLDQIKIIEKLQE